MWASPTKSWRSVTMIVTVSEFSHHANRTKLTMGRMIMPSFQTGRTMSAVEAAATATRIHMPTEGRTSSCQTTWVPDCIVSMAPWSHSRCFGHAQTSALECIFVTDTLKIDLQLLDAGTSAPAYAHAGDAGADLCSTIDFVLEPFERRVVPTGIAIALPIGYAAFVHP